MIEDKSNAAGILNLPYTVEAAERGRKAPRRSRQSLLGPYQAAGAFVMRGWARDNGAALERYLAAYVEAVRWIRRRNNRSEAVDLLIEEAQARPQDRRPHLRPVGGADDRLHARRQVRCRRLQATCWRCGAEIERKPETEAASPERYVDLHYYDGAMKLVGR